MTIYTLHQCRRLSALYKAQCEIFKAAGNGLEADHAKISEIYFLNEAEKIIAENQQGKLPR